MVRWCVVSPLSSPHGSWEDVRPGSSLTAHLDCWCLISTSPPLLIQPRPHSQCHGTFSQPQSLVIHSVRVQWGLDRSSRIDCFLSTDCQDKIENHWSQDKICVSVRCKVLVLVQSQTGINVSEDRLQTTDTVIFQTFCSGPQTLNIKVSSWLECQSQLEIAQPWVSWVVSS